MLRLRLENVCVPEQPLNSYPMAIAVTFSSGEIVNVTVLAWAVLPVHCPS